MKEMQKNLIIQENYHLTALPINEIGEKMILINKESQYEFFEYFFNKKHKELSNLLRIAKKFEKKLKNKIIDEDEQSAYQIGVLAGTIDTYRALLSRKVEENELNYQIKLYLSNDKPKAIMKYIYSNSYAQNKKIVSEFGPYSNKVLSDLIMLKCLEKRVYGKNTFYELTEMGIEYLEKEKVEHKKMIYFEKIEKEKYLEDYDVKYMQNRYNLNKYE